MSDSHPMLKVLGLADSPPADDPFPDPSAAAAGPTAQSADAEMESVSIAEALAALDEQGAPPVAEATPDVDPAAPAPVQYTPEQIAALVAENETFKAERAVQAAAESDAQFLAPWQRLQQTNDAFFDKEVERLWALGRSKGVPDAEIKAAVYERVELGDGKFGVPWQNPQTGQWELLGRIATGEVLRDNLMEAMVGRERSKNQPSALDQMAAKYGLDDAQRTALAKFVHYPRGDFEEIAKTLGANNQRLSSTLSDITQQATRNVAANLANGVNPGIPGAPAPQKSYQFRHTPDVRRQETELIARRLGFLRTG